MINEFEQIVANNACINKLKNSSVMITGATGVIGSYILKLLAYFNEKHGAGIKLVCPVRNIQKAQSIYTFSTQPTWVEYDLFGEVKFDFDIDYVIHCAAPTKSGGFVCTPVDTIDAVFGGTQRLLEYFRLHGKKSFLYLSSVEVYGENYDETKRLDEQTLGAVDSLSVRSSYTESKRLAETLCMSYSQQYGLSVKIARLSQILGVVEGDTRLIAYMCDCARQKKNIVLKSDGKATKAYCYIADSVSALLHILTDGESTAYNVANKDMVFSVYEIAKFVSERYGLGDVAVENKTETIYPKSSYLVMDATRLYALGWRPIVGIGESFDRLIGASEK